jgi:hypothetical protein
MNDLRTLSSQSYRIIALALLTALIHLFLGVQGGIAIFILNGLGFIALVAALYLLPQLAHWSTYIRWALVAYTAITIVAYFVVNPHPFEYSVGLITKAIEVILIVLLYLQKR